MSSDPVQSPAPSGAPTAPAQQGQDPVKSKAQQRIDSLVKRSSDAESKLTQLSQENAMLLDKLGQLSVTVERLSAGGTPAQSKPDPEPQGMEAQIAKAVGSVLGPLVEEARAERQGNTLLDQQTGSFERAVAAYPELGQPNSEEFKAFKQLFNGREEFLRSPDGPQLAAEVVRGILAASRSGSRGSDAAKNQAALFSPAPGQIQVTEGDEDVAKAVDAREKLLAKGVEHGWSDSEMSAWITLQLATGGRKA